MAGTHSRLSASGAPAYCRCPGKPNAERGLTDVTQLFAAEGTAAHEVLADCLDLGFEVEDFLGSIIEADGYSIEVTREMVKYLDPIVQKYRELSAGGTLYVEKRVSLEAILGLNQFGTTDIGVIRIQDYEIIIADLKYGAGVPIKPFDNVYDDDDGDLIGYRLHEQTSLYALGFWHTIAKPLFKGVPHSEITIRLIIEQPRCSEGGGEVSIKLPELLAFGDTLTEAADATWNPKAPRIPGEKQCQFCKRGKTRGGCPDKNAWAFGLLGLNPDRIDVYAAGKDIGLISPDLLTPEKRAYIAKNAGVLRKWINQVYDRVLDDALKGRDTPGLVAVVGRAPPRTWLGSCLTEAEYELDKILGKDAWKVELISPAQAEDVIPDKVYAERIAPLVDKRSASGASLAPIGTKRERATPMLAMLDELWED